MARFTNPLAHVRVASPCKVDWDQMMGSDRVRFCGQCCLNVYNLSAMTRDEAESVIARNEGRLCVRYYRRNDGSILTQDCPVGLRAVRERVSYWTKAIAAAVFTFLAALGFQSLLTNIHPLEPTIMIGSIREPADDVIMVQGGMELPPPPPQVTIGQVVLKRTPRHRRR